MLELLRYSAFAALRSEFARAAGFPPLVLMEGYLNDDNIVVTAFRSTYSPDSGQKWYGTISSGKPVVPVVGLPISWTRFEDDPICILMRRQVVTSEDCSKLADRMDELLPDLPGVPDDERYDVQEIARVVITNLRKANELGESVTWDFS